MATGLLAGAAVTVVVACLFVLPSLLVPSLPATLSGTLEKERLQLQNDRLKARNDARASLLQGLGGLVLIVGAYFTWQQIRLTRQGQHNERLKNAIEQLGSESVDARVAGVYFLGRALPGSRPDRQMIVDILTSHVQRRSALSPDSEKDDPAVQPRMVVLRQRALDIQAALTILGEHRLSREFRLWFADLDLRWSSLQNEFLYANFRGCRLDGAFMAHGDFAGARFTRARLERADLDHAVLTGASFEQANLRGAVLAEADVQGANFGDSDLERADLRAVRNLEASQLSEQQLRSAITDDRVRTYREETCKVASELASQAMALVAATPLSDDTITRLVATSKGDRDAVELATADCLRMRTDWIPRLRAAELLDQILPTRRQQERPPIASSHPGPASPLDRFVSGLHALLSRPRD